MYANVREETAGTLLTVFSGTEVSDLHYEQSLVEMDRVDRAAVARGIPLICVVVVDRDVPRPSAVWRKRFSAANHGVTSDRLFFVMVTTSILIRGVFTAVNWVKEPRQGQAYGVVGSVQDAQLWLQARGASAPNLLALEQLARANLAHSLSTARSG